MSEASKKLQEALPLSPDVESVEQSLDSVTGITCGQQDMGPAAGTAGGRFQVSESVELLTDSETGITCGQQDIGPAAGRQLGGGGRDSLWTHGIGFF